MRMGGCRRCLSWSLSQELAAPSHPSLLIHDESHQASTVQLFAPQRRKRKYETWSLKYQNCTYPIIIVEKPQTFMRNSFRFPDCAFNILTLASQPAEPGRQCTILPQLRVATSSISQIKYGKAEIVSNYVFCSILAYLNGLAIADDSNAVTAV